MILSTIRANSARSGYGSAASGAYYWDMPTTMVVGLATGETALNQTRLTFPSLPQALGGGKAITVSSLKLGLTQVSDATDGMSRTADVTAQFTTMSDWNVAYDIAAAVGVNGETEITIPASAAWLLETYTGNVFVHLKATDGPRASFAGWNTGDSAPYLKVLWDYAENTIHTDTVEATAGVTSVTWTIAPGADDARYVLAYRLGTATGTVYDGSGTSITWTPPYSVAEGIPDAASGQMELTLAVYDSDGALLRQETTYLRILVNGTLATVTNWVTTGTPNVSGRYLVGETEVSIGATFDTTAWYGATPKKVILYIPDMLDDIVTFTADQLTQSGTTWTTPTAVLGIAANAGQHPQEMALLDSRGMWSYYVGEDLLAPIAYDYARPSVSLFSAERYGEIIDDDQHVIGYQTDPTGNKVWFSASAAIASVGGANVMNWALTLTSRADGTVLTASGTATGTSLTWSDDRDLIGDTIDPEIVWDAALTITDSAGFTATAYDVVPAGKAVLHLPACKNGIAFGGLSTATAEHPLGEMFYPFYAYAGIHGVTGWSLKEEDTGGVWLDGQKVYRKTLYARIATAGQAVDIPFPDGLQRIVHMQGILYTDDTINRTRPLSWYYNASLNASLWHGGSANVTVQANGETGDAFVTIWYTKTAGIVITQQPEDVSVALGGTATFNVSALGSPTYQWQQSVVAATVGPAASVHVVDALSEPVDALTVDVTLTQDGSGDPSPSNVRTISEQTAAQIFVDRDGTSTVPVASIAFDRAVTGGTLNALTGAMTVTKQMDTYDGSSDETWEKMSNVGSRRYFRGRLSGQFRDANRRGTTGVTCNWLPVIAQSQDQSYTLSSMRLTTYTYTSNYIFVLLGTDLPDITTVELLRAYLAEHPLQISYPLWTPEAVTLTAAAVSTLAGENTVRADCGEVTMTYRCAESWSDISGETANALSVTASLEAAQRQYRCALTEGSAAAVSDAAGIVIQ